MSESNIIITLEQDLANLRKKVSSLEAQLAETQQVVASEAMFRRLVEGANDLIWSSDLDSNLTYLSPQFVEIFGYEVEEYLNQSFVPLIAPEDLPKVMEDLNQILATGKKRSGIEFRYYKKNGNWGWATSNTSPLQDADGKIVGFQGVLRDIGDRKTIEATLKEREERLRTISQFVPCAIYQYKFDPETGEQGFTYISTKAIELFEVEPSLLLESAAPIWEMMHPDDLPRVQISVADVLNNNSPWLEEFRIITPSGQKRWIQGRSEATMTPEGIGLHNGVFLDITDRKNAQKQQARLATIIEASTDLIGIANVAGYTIYINQAGQKLLGIPPEESVGIEIITVYSPSVRERMLTEVFPMAIETGSWSGETILLTRDGREITVSQAIVAHKKADGSLDCLSTIVRDISDRKAAEEALQESERRYRSLVETSQDMIWSVDAQGCFTFVNPAVRQIYGYEPEEMLGRPFTDFQAPPQKEKDLAVFERILAGESVFQYETIHLAKDGRSLNLFFNAMVLRDEEGNILGTTGTASNITGRKKVEAALAESETKFRRFVEDAEDLIYAIDLDGIFTYISPQFQEVLGYEAEQLLGKSFAHLIHPEDLSILAEHVQATLTTGERKTGIEFRAHHQNSNYFWLSANSSPIKNSEGNVIGLQGIARNITERKEAEQLLKQQKEDLEKTLLELQQTQTQLIQSEKMSSLGQLVAGVAHEINNPVNFIHGNIEHAQKYIEDLFSLLELYQEHHPQSGTIIAEHIEEIDLEFLWQDLPKLLLSMKVGTDRIRQIVLSLRNFSRLDESGTKAVNIHDGIDNTVTILQHRLKASPEHREIKVVRNYGNLPLIECYAGQLNQVFMNIIANAIDALDESQIANPQIEIRTELIDDQQVMIVIADNGPGVPESIKPRLFDPFFTTKPIGKGTGMGLSISYQIVTERHGGSLQVNSPPQGGTEFIIQIPYISSQ